jgi:hypothetical protein
MLLAQDGLDGFQVQPRAATINQGLEHVLQLTADFEQPGSGCTQLGSSNIDDETRCSPGPPDPIRSISMSSKSNARKFGSGPTVDHGNLLGLGIRADVATEAVSQAHQVMVVEGLI